MLTVAGTSSFTTTTGNDTILLNSISSFTGAVSLSTNGATADAELSNAAIALDLGTVGVGRNLVVETDAGSITDTGVLTVAGMLSFTPTTPSATILLNSTRS